MANKFLDYDGLSHFWDKLKAYFATKSQAVSNITRSGTTFTATRADGTTFTFTQQDNTVSPTTTTPKMDGTANVGSETKYAKGDHVHPSDTSRVPTSRTINGKALSSDVTISAGDIDSVIEPGEGSSLAADITLLSAATPTTTTPKMDGTANVGSETKYARGDHVHPSDTTRVPTSRTVNGHALSSNVNVTNLDLGQMYGTCSSAAGLIDKTVSMSGYLLTTGGIVSIKFTNAVGSAATLNINTKGAKPIYCNGSAILNNVIRAGDTATFIYDGTNYNLLSVIGNVTPIDVDYNSANGTLSIYTPGGNSYTTYTNAKIGNLLSDKLDSGDIGVANGVAPLNANAKIDAIYLPSYVDDVVEAYPVGTTELASNWLSLTASGSPLTPESGKIYILMTDSTSYSANSQFRWSGSTYVKMNDGGMSPITNGEIDTLVAS